MAASGVGGAIAAYSNADTDKQKPAGDGPFPASTEGSSGEHTLFNDGRVYWLGILERLAEPVLSNLARQTLKKNMPVECLVESAEDRRKFSHLEAFGRLMAGISPWLEHAPKSLEENRLRQRYADLARQSLDAATDPKSRDFMNFTQGRQPLVDAAFLAHAILRARTEFWKKLDPKIQTNTIAALKATRVIKPGLNNWLLFSATIEAALYSIGEKWNPESVDYALRQHKQWYKGDGVYGDGPEFHWDYYNSFVIQPMLLDVLKTVCKTAPEYKDMLQKVIVRARRYAEVQERMISPGGEFPPIGRSLAYRCGAFQLLAQAALTRDLPKSIVPSQVRCALSSVIHRTMDAPGTFDSDGWLKIGLCGHQPDLGERYISTGSLYLCAAVLLPLGLPSTDPFWSDKPADWTSKKIWSGQNVNADHALRDRPPPLETL